MDVQIFYFFSFFFFLCVRIGVRYVGLRRRGTSKKEIATEKGEEKIYDTKKVPEIRFVYAACEEAIEATEDKRERRRVWEADSFFLVSFSSFFTKTN